MQTAVSSNFRVLPHCRGQHLHPMASEGWGTAMSKEEGATLDVQGQRERAAWMMPLVLEAQEHPE